jgi:hypothetical protein
VRNGRPSLEWYITRRKGTSKKCHGKLGKNEILLITRHAANDGADTTKYWQTIVSIVTFICVSSQCFTKQNRCYLLLAQIDLIEASGQCCVHVTFLELPLALVSGLGVSRY